MQIKKLEEQLEITFNDHQLIKQAFTHSSYVNEHRRERFMDNERLEFLGDAVLELGVSQFIYKLHPNMPEGEMTKLRAAIVCEPALYTFAKELHFDAYILLGRGEEQTGGRSRPSLLADVFEAFLGALYLDQGYETTLQFLKTYIFPKISSGAFSHGMDFKSRLQELVQQQKDNTVVYQIVDEKGPSHDREFITHVLMNGKEVYGIGSGRTKKEAEQNAAKNAIDKLIGS